MKIQVFELPYDSGYRRERMGNCPAALMDAGLINRLRFRGHDVSIRRIRKRMAASIHQFGRVPARNIILAGIRETDDEEQALIDKSGVQQIPALEIQKRGIWPLLAPALAAMKRRVDQLYVHFDLDVLSPAVARWNEWTPRDGLTLEHVEEGLDVRAGDPPVTTIGFTSHEPTLDGDRSYEAAGC